MMIINRPMPVGMDRDFQNGLTVRLLISVDDRRVRLSVRHRFGDCCVQLKGFEGPPNGMRALDWRSGAPCDVGVGA